MSKVVSDYIIVTAQTYLELSMEVWEYLSKDWQPIGGVSFDDDRYLQATVKYKDKEE